MVKSLTKVVYCGLKIFVKSLKKSLQQEIEFSKELARIRYQENEPCKRSEQTIMPLEEAKRILDINEPIDLREIENRYKHLFEANKGFRYLQSKVYRAKQTIDGELFKSGKAKYSESKGKCLFFSCLLANDERTDAT